MYEIVRRHVPADSNLHYDKKISYYKNKGDWKSSVVFLLKSAGPRESRESLLIIIVVLLFIWSHSSSPLIFLFVFYFFYSSLPFSMSFPYIPLLFKLFYSYVIPFKMFSSSSLSFFFFCFSSYHPFFLVYFFSFYPPPSPSLPTLSLSSFIYTSPPIRFHFSLSSMSSFS